MKRIQKFRILFAVRIVFSLLYIVLIELSMIHIYTAPQPQYYILNTLLIAGGIVLIADVFYNGCIRKVSLTKEERQTALVTPCDFSNSSNWYYVVMPLIYSLIVLVIIIFPPFYQATRMWQDMSLSETISNALHALPAGLWIIISFVIAYPLVLYTLNARNQYKIYNDTLTILEYHFFRAEPELRIPLDTICEVSIQYLYTFSPRLYITLQAGDAIQIRRRIYASTHILELAVALCQKNADNVISLP